MRLDRCSCPSLLRPARDTEVFRRLACQGKAATQGDISGNGIPAPSRHASLQTRLGKRVPQAKGDHTRSCSSIAECEAEQEEAIGFLVDRRISALDLPLAAQSRPLLLGCSNEEAIILALNRMSGGAGGLRPRRCEQRGNAGMLTRPDAGAILVKDPGWAVTGQGVGGPVGKDAVPGILF